LELNREDVLHDYSIAIQSREASLIGRREVFSGKAKFGIFGDGKEVAQVAMARSFRKGDFRSGYYRDQTFMLALGVLTLEQWFAQLYAHPDVEAEPASAGRSMNCHFATRSLYPDGRWKDLKSQYNSSADISPTGSQMPRLLGLAQASKMYRQLGESLGDNPFSSGGDEVAWGTIGNASCAEGMFWETLNAACVLQVPMLLSIWDDEYGISVPNRYQIAKQDLTEVLMGFQRQSPGDGGLDVYTVPGWNYSALCETYSMASEGVRRTHVPAVLHVKELTQPQGHSTSGSHERYKSPERLQWEADHDCLKKMREWILATELATEETLVALEAEGKQRAEEARDRAWEAYIAPIRDDVATFAALAEAVAATVEGAPRESIEKHVKRVRSAPAPLRRDILTSLQEVLIEARGEDSPARRQLIEWRDNQRELAADRYASHLYNETETSALRVPPVPPVFGESPRQVNGSEVINACFDANLKKYPQLLAFGEDLGKLGDVNKGFDGLQDIYGELRVSDVGIRECTILGQAIGMAMRGLRPIAEVQYLDYLLYALQIMSDDLATVQYRTKGGQKAPVIVRTRGHRLEGIWHSGSPMAGVINLVRGIHVCVPRNLTQAAGMYNTLLQSDDPALVVEVLNGYRLKETMPENIGEMTVPLGIPETLREGTDVTLVTYGACCRIALAASETLSRLGVEVEVIDVQTLLPFDLEGRIVESLKKTNRIVFLDEDMPGGTTAYMLREVLEVQAGFHWLDAEPRTLPAKPHRPSYGSDGDYFAKPNAQDVVETVYDLMHAFNPQRYPMFYRQGHDRKPQ
jgi:pyruvate/2-oxoglutarate/acetoin dehydrogenase E1 component/TPP-dependent pyruvate/acetoin dehydrogenase alpha subunit